MAYYKISVDVSDLFDDMLVQAQKSFLIDKFCSLAAVGGCAYDECIPYNDQTKHLLGTTDEWKGGEG
jgi:hypothetical protein|nr:MAG TPA: hypothetical protein [Caudoviricetes sp.]